MSPLKIKVTFAKKQTTNANYLQNSDSSDASRRHRRDASSAAAHTEKHRQGHQGNDFGRKGPAPGRSHGRNGLRRRPDSYGRRFPEGTASRGGRSDQFYYTLGHSVHRPGRWPCRTSDASTSTGRPERLLLHRFSRRHCAGFHLERFADGKGRPSDGT